MIELRLNSLITYHIYCKLLIFRNCFHNFSGILKILTPDHTMIFCCCKKCIKVSKAASAQRRFDSFEPTLWPLAKPSACRTKSQSIAATLPIANLSKYHDFFKYICNKTMSSSCKYKYFDFISGSSQVYL